MLNENEDLQHELEATNAELAAQLRLCNHEDVGGEWRASNAIVAFGAPSTWQKSEPRVFQILRMKNLEKHLTWGSLVRVLILSKIETLV